MNTTEIMTKTQNMIDELKAVCTRYGLGNTGNEYKIITEVFLYKFINDKLLHDLGETLQEQAVSADSAIKAMSEDEYQIRLMTLPASTARLGKNHFVSCLADKRNNTKDNSGEDFSAIFDRTLAEISDLNKDTFSVSTGAEADSVQLFDSDFSTNVDSAERNEFCRAIINKISAFSFEEAFEQKYDFFAAIFEYLIKDYNKDFGKYAEYYTPHSIAEIIAQILAPNGAQDVEVYDPAAGSGTLVLALAHQIGENNCTIYTQDISKKSNEFLRLNLILNNLVHSIKNVIKGDTLLKPYHKEQNIDRLKHFDYIVSNPPFKTDFSDTRDRLAEDNYKSRFWAGVPSIPNKKKESMEIYLMFLQHIIFSLKDTGKAAIVVPTGFLTAQSGIPFKIRQKLIDKKWLRGVVSMPSNIFATTGTNVSVLFIDKADKPEDYKVILLDASKLGEKIKVDKNQRTVLRDEEIAKIIKTFNGTEQIEDFSVLVSYDQITEKKYSFSAGQYFEVKIDYVDLTPEEFEQKMNEYKTNLKKYFEDGIILQDKICSTLDNIHYD